MFGAVDCKLVGLSKRRTSYQCLLTLSPRSLREQRYGAVNVGLFLAANRSVADASPITAGKTPSGDLLQRPAL